MPDPRLSGPPPRVIVRLSPGERLRLARVVRSRSAPLREVQRAQFVLQADRGERPTALARHLHFTENAVRLWRRLYVVDPEHGLED